MLQSWSLFEEQRTREYEQMHESRYLDGGSSLGRIVHVAFNP